jgi:hypothetical protein
MSQIAVRIISRYAPIITFPVALVLGFIGYSIESSISNRKTPQENSIIEERAKRILNEGGDTLIVSSNNQKTIFEKNDPKQLLR